MSYTEPEGPSVASALLRTVMIKHGQLEYFDEYMDKG